MSVGAILTVGLGVFGSVNLLPTLGYGASVAPPAAVATATPGFPTRGRVRDLDQRPRYESEAQKLARRIREGTIADPAAIVPRETTDAVQAEYAAKSARLSAGIATARAEAEAARQAIARLEAAQVKRQTAKLAKDLIRAEQALQLASVQEAVLLEEMEIIDVAYCAIVALGVILQ